MSATSGKRGGRAVRLRVADDPLDVAAVRARLERIGAEVGLDDAAVFGLKVAVTEAVANALRHPDTRARAVAVMLAAREDAVEVEVENDGAFRMGDGLDPERGRGLPLMLALTDEVEFATSPQGMRVRLTKRAGRAAA